MQLFEALKQWVVFLEALTESKARIEHEPLPLNSRRQRDISPLPEFAFHQSHNIGYRWQSAPLLWTSTHMHQHGSAFQLSQDLQHLRIPAKPTHIVHHLRS